MLNSLAASTRKQKQHNSVNARPIYLALALFNPFLLKVVHRQSPSHGLKTPVDRLTRCHPLTLIVSRSKCNLLTGCVYLHAYLVFKEPTAARQWRPTRHLAHSHRPGRCLEGPAACRPRQRLGEPCEVTITTDPCQPPQWQRQTFRRLLMSWKDARARNCCVNPGRFPTGERSASIAYQFEYVK